MIIFYLKRVQLIFFLFLSNLSFSQQKYWVTFTDKSGVVFNPYEYFDERTISQRISNHISLIDSTDFPVNEKFISQVASIVDRTSFSSRWLNGLAVYATEY